MPAHLSRTGRLAAAAGALLAILIPAQTLAVSATWTRQFGTVAEEIAGGIAQDSGRLHRRRHHRRPARPRASRAPTTASSAATTATGKVLWTRQFGTGSQDMAIDVAADSGGLTIIGVTDGSFTGGAGTLGTDDIFVRRYDRAGTPPLDPPVRDRQGRGRGRDRRRRAPGSSSSAPRGAPSPGTNTLDDPDAFVRKYDRQGNVMWTRQFGTPDGDTADAVSIDGGGFTVGGGTDGDLGRKNAGPFTDMYVRRYTAAGNAVWTRQWGQKGDDQALSVAGDGTGVTAVGYTHADQYGNASSQAFIRRYDRAGNLVFGKIFGSVDSEIAWGVAADSAAITVTGYTYGSMDAQNKGSFDVFVRRYDRAGNVVWKQQFGTGGADLGMDVAADGTGFTILGHTNGKLVGRPQGRARRLRPPLHR